MTRCWLRAALLLACLAPAEQAYVAMSVAANSTAYYATANAPSVLCVGRSVAVPLYANITGASLTPDGASLFVALSTNVVMRLAGLSADVASLSALPHHASAVAAGRAGIWAFPRDGPPRYARFVSIGAVRASADALTIIDSGSVRRLAWASGFVSTLTNVTDAVAATTAGTWTLVVRSTGALTAHSDSQEATLQAAGVLDADLLIDSTGAPVAYYITAGGLFRRVLDARQPDPVSLKLRGATRMAIIHTSPPQLWLARYSTEALEVQPLAGCACSSGYTPVTAQDGWVCVAPPPGPPKPIHRVTIE